MHTMCAIHEGSAFNSWQSQFMSVGQFIEKGTQIAFLFHLVFRVSEQIINGAVKDF